MGGKDWDRLVAAKARPDDRGTRALARRLLEGLERERNPSPRSVARLADNALFFARLGLAERGSTLCRRWLSVRKRSGSLLRADAVFTLALAPRAASSELRERARGDVAFAALETIGCVLRGELADAVALARRHQWYLGSPASVDGTGYALWALLLMGRQADAEHVLGRWRRVPYRPGEINARHMRLFMEARAAAFRLDFAREEGLLDEARALSRRHGLGIATAFTEISLAVARAKGGDLEGAHASMRAWPEPRGRADLSVLEAHRQLARADVALLAGERREAERRTRSALAFFLSVGHAVLECQARLTDVLSAPPARARAALDAYRRVAHRHPIEAHRRRARVLEATLSRAGGRLPSTLDERSRYGCEPLPFSRLFAPRSASLAADLYWDRIQGEMYLAGAPLALAGTPVMRRLFEALAGAPGFALGAPELFEAVWQMRYHPLRHETKLAVALHRARRVLDARAAGGAEMIVLSGGVVALADHVDARVVELARREGAASADDVDAEGALAAAVRASLADGPLPPRELARRLDASPSALKRALAALVDAGEIERLGAGRAVRYRPAAPPPAR